MPLDRFNEEKEGGAFMTQFTRALLPCTLAICAFINASAISEDSFDAEPSRMTIAQDAQESYERGITLTDLDPQESVAAFSQSADGSPMALRMEDYGRIWVMQNWARAGWVMPSTPIWKPTGSFRVTPQFGRTFSLPGIRFPQSSTPRA
jgi:hypothetical protein